MAENNSPISAFLCSICLCIGERLSKYTISAMKALPPESGRYHVDVNLTPRMLRLSRRVSFIHLHADLRAGRVRAGKRTVRIKSSLSVFQGFYL